MERTEIRHALNLLTIIIVLFFAGYFLEEAIDLSSVNVEQNLVNYIEILTELLSVFVSFAIFTITWHAHGKNRDNHSLFLGWAFLVSGFFLMLHVFSYPFMPAFITPNSPNKSAIFLIESRLILFTAFIASAYIYNDTYPKYINRRILPSFLIISLAITLAFVSIHYDYSLNGFDIETVSSTAIFLLSIYTVIILYSSYLYSKRLKQIDDKNIIYLIYGFIIIGFSNLVYFSFELPAHLLIIVGFFFMYHSLYMSSIELPYEKLALAEEKLRIASEERYRNLFDNANDAIITIDLEENITSWNKSAERIFGWEAREVIGKNIPQLIVPANAQAERALAIRDVRYGKVVSGIDVARLHKNGNKIDLSLTVSPILDGNKNIIGFSGIFRDLTERRLAEEKLREERDKAQKYLDVAGIMFLVLNHDQTVALINKKGCEILGYEEKEITGRKWGDTFLPERIRDELKKGFEMLISGNIENVEYFENPVLTRSGKEKIIAWHNTVLTDKDGKIVGTLSSGEDITERRKSLERLEASENKYRVLLDNLPQKIFSKDINSVYISCNNSFARDLHINPDDIAGKTDFDFSPRE
ncbi:PAS fold protein [uncultured archaeon]|nr:PAS fold protein [uncultured archaeon]